MTPVDSTLPALADPTPTAEPLPLPERVEEIDLLRVQLAEARVEKLQAQATLLQEQTARVAAELQAAKVRFDAESGAIREQYRLGPNDRVLTSGAIVRSGA
jgi:hypothetical protein